MAFQSYASNLLGDASDIYGLSDIFVSDGYSQLVRVSVSSGGVQANGHSFEPSISAGGRFVAFSSGATNLAAGNDTNGKSDVFLRDRDTDEDGVFDEVGAVSTTLVSSAINGGAGNGASALAYITANGRYIVFTSWASDLVSGDSNGVGDVFVYDRQLDKMTRVSVGENGEQGDDGSFSPVISDDGDYVIFESDASNLTEDDQNEYRDIFVHYAGFSATFSLEILPSEKVYIPIVLGSPNG
jgi:Tol biopolymer transport system component